MNRFSKAVVIAPMGLALLGCTAVDSDAVRQTEQYAVLQGSVHPSNTVDVCFVTRGYTDPAAISSTVSNFRSYMEQFEDQSDLDFRFKNDWDTVDLDSWEGPDTTYNTTCTWTTSGGKIEFNEELRIFIENGSCRMAGPWPAVDEIKIPGDGCTLDSRPYQQYVKPNGKFSGDPSVGPERRCGSGNTGYGASLGLFFSFPSTTTSSSTKTCLYTGYLTAGTRRNRYQHEVGHALGLAHEHYRQDATSVCPHGSAFEDDGVTPMSNLSTRYVTEYEHESVMHYGGQEMSEVDGKVRWSADPDCVHGMDGNDGLQPGDKMVTKFLYPGPHDGGVHTARITHPGLGIKASSAWEIEAGSYGAPGLHNTALMSFDWKLDGSSVGSSRRLNQTLSEGYYSLELTYEDLLNRTTTTDPVDVEVVSEQEFKERTVSAAPTGGILL